MTIPVQAKDLWARLPPPWSSMRGLGNSRLLRSSFFWIAFVPIAARVFAAVPLELELPFTWEIFFYSALFASGANAVYLLACPSLVKDYLSSRDFREQGKGCEQLRRELEMFLLIHHRSFEPEHLQKTLTNFCASFSDNQVDFEAVKVHAALAPVQASKLRLKDTVLDEAFWSVREVADKAAYRSRWLCWILYVVAFALAGLIFGQNIAFVLCMQLAD